MSLRTRSSASAVRSSARRKEASPQHREPRESSTRGRTRKNPRSPSGSPSISEAQLREGAARESGNSQRDASLNSAYAEPMEDVEELTPPPETSSESEDQGHDLPRRLSPAEKAREKRLQADRMVRIHNPRLVQCRRCDTYIKLSAKSQFDLAHWRTHRERCLRRSDSMVAELKGTNDKKVPTYSQDTTVSRTSRRRVPSTTPSLTPETDGSGPSSTVSAIEPKSTPRSESPLLLEELTPPPPTPPSTPPPPPPPPPSSRVPTQRALDPAFEEYLARSQRRPTSQVSPRLFTSWQDWRWSRLRAPVWLPHETRPGSVDASGAYGLDMDEDDDMPSKFALSACRDEPYHPTAPV